VTVDPSGHFVYIANSVSADVSAFTIDSTTGALKALAGSPFSTGAGMEIAGASVDPLGKFLYVANFGSSSVSAFAINATSGALTAVGSPFPVDSGPRSVQVDPSGKFAYVPNLASDEVEVFSIGATGALSVASRVRTRPHAAALALGMGTTAVTYTPKFAYVANQNSNNVSMYTINATTGALASTGTVTAGTQPVSAVVDPSGKFAYVANLCGSVSCSGGGDVLAYTIDGSTGVLSPVPGSPFAAGNSPRSVAVDPSGKFAYVANSGSGDVSAYTISSTTGALTPVVGSPFTAGTTPFSVTVDPSGRFAYVANLGSGNVTGDVSAYTIDSITGALSPVAGSPFLAGTFPDSVTVDSSGRFAYVVNECGNVFCSLIGSVSAYAIDSTTGALSPVPGSPFTTGMSPRSVTVDPSGKFAYVANGSSSDVSAYTIDSTTGTLSPVTGSPFGAGAGPRSVAVDPSDKFSYVANQCGDFACTVIGNVSAYTLDSSTGALSPVTGSPFAAGMFALSVVIAGTIR
jgi:6-phosphogluconolactonase (cycloisomerase 2 family)